VLPRTCLARIRDGQAYVQKAWITATGHVIASVFHGDAVVNGVHESADANYEIRPDWTLERAWT
jgi:hypothetical protein